MSTLPALTHAQSRPTGLSSDDRTYLERVALGSARSRLAEAVAALPLAEGLTVGAWAGRNVERDRSLRQWVRSRPAAGPLRVYSDATAEQDVRVEAGDLGEFLSSLPGLEATDAAMLKSASRRWSGLWQTGESALSQRGGPQSPAGWEDISFEGVQVSRRAAQADALRWLLERAGRLKVTNARELSEFLRADPAIDAAVASALLDQARFEFELAADQVAVVTAQISSPALVRILQQVVEEHGHRSDFRAADFREMAAVTPDTTLREQGMAVPPPRYRLTPEFRLIELDVPEWAGRTLRAEVRAVPDSPGDEAALRSAAVEEFTQRVGELPITPEVTVARLLASRPELKDDVIVFLHGARLVNVVAAAGDAPPRATAELPLQRLWQIVRRGIPAVEADPPEPPATTRPALPPRLDRRPTDTQPARSPAANPETRP
ncbi:MAG: hypothetical protein IPM64_14445 [Phycisphaerales bacterium]|nr:hypothetical protein [Phycisphaerales bacterium]